MATPKEAWRALRRLRADPPGRAADAADRRQVFQAALAQAEELWDAAAAAGAASRPLPLFYCLSQAGRALCAAWDETDNWQPRAHGLGREERVFLRVEADERRTAPLELEDEPVSGVVVPMSDYEEHRRASARWRGGGAQPYEAYWSARTAQSIRRVCPV
jgi:YaaC-like protein